jgi:ATP-binding cassette subfamily B protein/subfamily B ATP-binding cassette protein MsbA
MKNFLRALRHAWPYRRRLLCSVLCAFFAAVLWGMNFTSIYPVLKLLHTGDSLHQWVDGRIAAHQKDIAELQGRVDGLDVQAKDLEKLPSSKQVEKQKRDLTAELMRLEVKLRSSRAAVYWYQVARKYIVALLPDDCFLTLVYLIGVVFVGIVIKCIFEFFHESLVGSVVNLSLFDLRNRFFRNAVHLDVGQFNEHGTTELMARFTNDMESLGGGMKMLFGKVVAEPLRIIACIAIACLISWQLTLMFLILVPFAALVLVRVSRLMKRASRRVLERMSNIYKILQEVFQGIRVVKLSTTEAHERRRFRAATRDYYRRSMMVVNIEALADPIIEVLGVLAVAVALLVGSYLVLSKHTHLLGVRLTDGPMEPESMLQLYILMAAIADPVRKLSSVLTRLQSGSAASDRIFAFIDRYPRVAANHDGVPLKRPAWLAPRPGGAPPSPPPVLPLKPPYVELRDVCFSYEPRTPILSHINLSVRAGETIALVGPNGCGKTTLAGLLARFFDPDHGSVLIDGVDLREAQLRSLRRLLGMVTQDTFLFDDTVYRNIAYGCPGVTREQVEAAARQAFAHEFIMALPAGYESRVGERGALLSGGQKQRLALARALLRDPAIMILDEFTSQNDAESEASIHSALKEFKQGRTVFVITHRLNTLEIADRIVVLEAGHIVAVGTHAELIAGCAVYQRLHEAQGQRKCA